MTASGSGGQGSSPGRPGIPSNNHTAILPRSRPPGIPRPNSLGPGIHRNREFSRPSRCPAP